MNSQVWPVKVWRRIVAWGFEQLYHQMAWSYDAVSWGVSLGRWQQWQQAVLPFIIGPRVLEVAHGPGHLLLALHQAGYQVTGLDQSAQMGRLARARLQDALANVGLARGQAQALPFASNVFDCLVVTFPTRFILETTTWQAAARVLRPGGRLLILPAARLLGRGPAPRLIGWLYHLTGQTTPTELDMAAVWTPWLTALAAAGLPATVYQLPLAGSEAWLLVAEKKSG